LVVTDSRDHGLFWLSILKATFFFFLVIIIIVRGVTATEGFPRRCQKVDGGAPTWPEMLLDHFGVSSMNQVKRLLS
jgi:hypothetical protein